MATYNVGAPLESLRYLEQVLGVDRYTLRSVAHRAGGMYVPFDRRARKGEGKWRHIDNPVADLKQIQKAITRRLLRQYEFPRTMLGGIRGGSVRANAQPHLGQEAVAVLDLRDCFPRTSNVRVYEALVRRLRCSPVVASLLTKLMTLHFHVPQGAPTSCAIVNLTLLPLHDEIQRIAQGLGLNATMWVDDITISGDRTREALDLIIRAIQRHGHAVRSAKTKVMSNAVSQEVTGVFVNAKPSIGQDRKLLIRRRILEVSADAVINDRDLKSIWGHIAYAKLVSPAQGSALERLALQLLPDSGAEGTGARRDETRPCPNPSAHRFRTMRK